MKIITKTLFAALLFAGINSAYADTQDRHLSGFQAINESGPFDIYIKQGTSESVKVEAPANYIDKIITEVNNGELTIRQKNQNFSWGNMFNNSHQKIAVYVTVKDLHSIHLSGSGDAYFKDGIRTNRMEIRCSGSGDVWGKLNVSILEVGGSGSGDLKLSGSAETLSVRLTGSGDFSGRDLLTSSTAVSLSGSGDASVNASKKLDARITGSGDIRYTGGASQVSAHSSGSGDIHKF